MNKTAYEALPPDHTIISAFIAASLHEDVGSGDHTSRATIPADVQNTARLLVKDTGVLAGVELAGFIFEQVDPELEMTVFLTDGTFVKPGDVAFEVKGPARSILTAERLVLNCMQRMSGIATATQHLVQLLNGLHTRVLDTRKTTPGFRYFEKWAVRIGGGTNHRFGLYDMVMIKDNHVDYAGGIKAALERTHVYLEKNKLQLPIELEVRNLGELEQALEAGGMQRIMLDNFTPENLAAAVKRIGGRFETEASGGITEHTIRAFAETGVDFISVGAITHHFRSLDLSLKAVRS